MKARIMNRTVDIPDERMAKGSMEGRAGELPRRNVVGIPRTPIGGKPTQSDQSVSSPAPSPLPGWPKPTDKWNYSFAQHLEMEKQAGRIKLWFYEPFSFWLVPADPSKGERGVRHKVDFMVWYPDGLERPLHMIEVKGRGQSRNLRDGITRFKVAADKFPCFQWSMVKRVRHGWEEY